MDPVSDRGGGASSFVPWFPNYGGQDSGAGFRQAPLSRYERIESKNQGTYEKHTYSYSIASCVCSGFRC
jgi:hypothetical protein